MHMYEMLAGSFSSIARSIFRFIEGPSMSLGPMLSLGDPWKAFDCWVLSDIIDPKVAGS